MRNVSAIWVPRLLTLFNKCNHETISQQCLTLFKPNPKVFLHRFVNVDNTLIHFTLMLQRTSVVEMVDFTQGTYLEEGENCPMAWLSFSGI